MTRLIKANMQRMFKHIFFIPGLILAFLITLVAMNFRLTTPEAAQYWHRFAALGIAAFFSLFIPLFIGQEYKDGAIRNKLIAGHKQSTIYIADLISSVIGVSCMTFVWALAGVIDLLHAGYSVGISFAVDVLMIWAVMSFYASIITLFAMRIRRIALSCAAGIAFFVVSYFLGVTVFSVNMLAESKVSALIENLFPLGQWFGIMNQDECLPSVARIAFSVVLLLIVTVIGTASIDKRELN